MSNDAPQQISDEVRAVIGDDLAVDFVEFPREPKTEGTVALRGRLQKPSEGAVALRGRLQKPSEEVFPRWLRELNTRGYTPTLTPDPDGATDQHVVLRVIRGVAPQSVQNPVVNLVLFIITLISTLFTGAAYGTTQASSLGELLLPQNLIQGWPFALTLMGILTAHEFGHYFAARYHKVAVTLPYFLPLPPPIGIFGTLGAFIRLKEPISDRRKLFDIGVAGPLAGLVLAVPLLFVGLSASPMTTLVPGEGMLEGNSFLYYFAKWVVFGQTLPNFETGADVLMNQVTFAAWTGLLVTALNLLPVGQLDGGHTVFALFGQGARRINNVTIALLAILAVAGIPMIQDRLFGVVPQIFSVGFVGWFLWIVLIYAVIGPHHPPALDDVTTLDPKRRMLGYLVILIFVLIFTPVPLRPY